MYINVTTSNDWDFDDLQNNFQNLDIDLGGLE